LIVLIVAACAALCCAGCAQPGVDASAPSPGGITMYGTVDTGVTVKR
jgi:hypothetical protein